jgi:hypothetical protein
MIRHMHVYVTVNIKYKVYSPKVTHLHKVALSTAIVHGNHKLLAWVTLSEPKFIIEILHEKISRQSPS